MEKLFLPITCYIINMIYGYVMIECKTGSEQAVFKKLQTLEQVEEVHPLFGEFDFIMRVKARDPDHLARFIIDQIRKIEGIENTKTFLEASFGPETLKKK